MAKGRFISKDIATDRELNVLCSFEADYLFQRCIPHLDVEGRMEGFADVVKATAVPLRSDLDVEMVRACLAELQKHDLVRWYDVENRRYLEFPGFADHQKGLRPEREADSKCPPANSSDATPVEYAGPTPDQLRMRSAQEKLSEGKSKSKFKGSEGSSLRSSPSGAEPRVENPPEDDSGPDGEDEPDPTPEKRKNPWGPTVTACQEHLWLDDDPPGDISRGQELSCAGQICDRWNLDPPEMPTLLEGFGRLRDQGFWGEWVEPEEPASLRALNRRPADEQGIPAVVRCLHEMRKNGSVESDERGGQPEKVRAG